jgi:poly-gamma-glutamate synthesis protein (capsule biosynthesis protein)
MTNYIEQIKSGVINIRQGNTQNGVRIIVAGDLCPDQRVETLIMENRIQELYNDVHQELKNKDISIVNLECPLTKNINPIDKRGPKLSANPDTIELIKYGQFDFVTLANNHVLDQGHEGLMDTIHYCKSHGINVVGAGATIHDARQFQTITVKGKKIAILNFAEIEFSIADEKCGGANPLNPVQNYYQIIEAKKQADIVLVIVHGGVEKSSLPSPDFVETLHFFADLGVSAVIAHHSHCAGGIEIHNNVPIFYSLGNFIFDRENQYKPWYKSFFIRMTFFENNVGKIQIIPFFQFEYKSGLQLMNKEEEKNFLQK